MTTAPTEEAPSLPNLVTIGAVSTATIVVFFGVGFLLLSLPKPATQPADPAPSVKSSGSALGSTYQPANNDTPPSASAALPANNVAAAETSSVQSDPEAPASASIVISTASITPARTTRAKRIIISRRRHGPTERRSMVVWRLNAYPGPNPGGGFYGAPNINVGQINPK
jgi:hypothetical protein